MWLELLCESDFHCWGKFMDTFLAAKELLEESAEQRGNECPHFPLNALLLNAIRLSSSAREMTALIHFLGLTTSALGISVLICLDIPLPILTVWASHDKTGGFNLPVKKQNNLHEASDQVKLSQLYFISTYVTERKSSKLTVELEANYFLCTRYAFEDNKPRALRI